MPWYARVFMVIVGPIAIAGARYSYRQAPSFSAQARRFGAIPRALSGTWGYRIGAVLTGAVGLMFIGLGLLAK